MATRQVGKPMINAVRFCVAFVALAVLSSCYVPDDYTAEIRVTRTGKYGMAYVGPLTWAPLYGQIARGELDQEEAESQAAGFLTALKQDSNFTSVSSLGRGRYDVRYDRRGRFTKTQMLSFVRRNARIFELRAVEDGRVFISGRRASDIQADQLEQIGLQTQGLMRVVTDAAVLAHNATSVRPSPTPGYTIYDWRMTSFRQPAPSIELKLDGRLATTGL